MTIMYCDVSSSICFISRQCIAKLAPIARPSRNVRSIVPGRARPNYSKVHVGKSAMQGMQSAAGAFVKPQSTMLTRAPMAYPSHGYACGQILIVGLRANGVHVDRFGLVSIGRCDLAARTDIVRLGKRCVIGSETAEEGSARCHILPSQSSHRPMPNQAHRLTPASMSGGMHAEY